MPTFGVMVSCILSERVQWLRSMAFEAVAVRSQCRYVAYVAGSPVDHNGIPFALKIEYDCNCGACNTAEKTQCRHIKFRICFHIPSIDKIVTASEYRKPAIRPRTAIKQNRSV